MSYRHNPALDDAFGITPALLPPARIPRNPAERQPIRVPEGYYLDGTRILKAPEPRAGELFPDMLETAGPGTAGNASGAAQAPQPAPSPPLAPIPRLGASLTLPQVFRKTVLERPEPEPVLATVPEAATVLEKDGEDLLYSGGVWWHRCNHCGPTEDVLVVSRGRNPRRVTRPVFDVPRDETIRHGAGCPYAGQF